MTRAAAFAQSDITKILKGARTAGVTVGKIEIDVTGRIVAHFGEVRSEESTNEWDEVLKSGKEERSSTKRH